MKRFGLTPLLVLAAIATAMLVAARYTPYFPGDVALARGIQAVAPPGDWARAVTRAAYAPWIYGVLAVSALAAFRVAGWRGAAAMAVTFFVFMQVEQPVKDMIGRARPNPSMGMTAAPSVAVTPAGHSMPSGWALLFGSTVGLLGAIAWTNTRGVARSTYVAGCAFVLLAGLAARVSLGAHWPSDVIAGYLLAIVVGVALFQMLDAVKGPRAKGRGQSKR